MAKQKTIPPMSVPVASPDPQETTLMVRINRGLMDASSGKPFGTRYRDCPTTYVDPSKISRGYGDYILCDVRNGADDIIWIFGKDKTDEEKNTPFRVTRSLGNHYWPPILLGISPQKSRIPRSVDTGNRIYRGNNYAVTPIWIPSADTGTLFILREYLSATEFEIPQWPTPITAPVSFPVPGQGMFNFPESLHPELSVDSFEDSFDYFDSNTLGIISNVGLTTPWTFPATTPKTWETYILYDRQTKDESGLWHRTQMEVNPPNLPRRQRGFA